MAVLVVYGLMLVVPAGVFGSLYWSELKRDHEQQAARAPQDARSAAARMHDALAREIGTLIENERQRSFLDYAPRRWESSGGRGTLIPSPLATIERPKGLLAWFTFDQSEGVDARPNYYFGLEEQDGIALLGEGDMAAFVQRWAIDPTYLEGEINAIYDLIISQAIGGVPTDMRGSDIEDQKIGLVAMASFLRPFDKEVCDVYSLARADGAHPNEKVPVYTYDQRYVLARDRQNQLRLMGFQRVSTPGRGRKVNEELLPACLDHLNDESRLIHGWVADAELFLHQLPREIQDIELAANQQLFFNDEFAGLEPERWETAPFSILDGLEITQEGLGDGVDRLYVGVDVSGLSARSRSQTKWFTSLALIMGSSALLGLRLLIGRLRAASENARRTENFVASITHELRTPLASVKLYGEMLSDGWATTEAKRKEYADRIVTESNRLDALVDRVLEKRRLSGAPPELVPGDLNLEIRQQRSALKLEEDPSVRFEFEEGLPPVLLTEEAVHTLLSNLIENAKKYAPVSKDDPQAEPLIVRTRRNRRGRVVLEVLDRGPGIPPAERDNIFEAFYRIGNESTRTTQGTGLGLHLVAQYAKTLKGKVHVHARDKGGTRFQVTFKTAR
ncbi:MAG: signal transduction histidine kinase [Planctomycetota bacterium]|jgi:signal transduction histidine kinase